MNIREHSKDIVEDFLATKSKVQTARKFGISEYGVSTALYHVGMEALVCPSILKIMSQREAKPIATYTPEMEGGKVKRKKRSTAFIREHSKDIVEDFLATKSKVQTARKFGISPSAVVGALYYQGMDEYVPSHKLARFTSTNSPREGNLLSEVPEAKVIIEESKSINHEMTWEDIIKAIPDRLELASLVLDGLVSRMEQLSDQNNKLHEDLATANKTVASLTTEVAVITEDRRNVMQQYNEMLVKQKTAGHFGIDTMKHILVPKDRA